jgi:hypothetical protein
MDPNAIITTSAASEELVAALPRIVFGDTARAKEAVKGEVMKCRICLEEMYIDTNVILLPCGHADCAECVVEWLKAKDSCHVCRAGVVKADDEDAIGKIKADGKDGKQAIVDTDGDVEMSESSSAEEMGQTGNDTEEKDLSMASEDLGDLISAAAEAERRLSVDAGNE